MVIPNVELGDLPVRIRERLDVVPPNVVFQVVIIALDPELLRERILSAFLRVADISPRTERAIDTDSIIVYLVATSDHDVERHLAVFSHHIIPQGSTTPSLLVCADTEAIARMKHDAHGLSESRDEETVESRLVVGRVAHFGDFVFKLTLGFAHRHHDVELPEGIAGVGIEAVRLDQAVPAGCAVGRSVGDTIGARSKLLDSTCGTKGESGLIERRLAATLDYNQYGTNPIALVHSAIVEERTANDLLTIIDPRTTAVLRRIVGLVITLGMAGSDSQRLVVGTTMGAIALRLDPRLVQKFCEVASGIASGGLAGLALRHLLALIAKVGRGLLVAPATVGRVRVGPLQRISMRLGVRRGASVVGSHSWVSGASQAKGLE